MSKEYYLLRLFDQGGEKKNLNEAAQLVSNGWVPIRETSCTAGGGMSGWAWLCVFEREKDESVQNSGLVTLLENLTEAAKQGKVPLAEDVEEEDDEDNEDEEDEE